MICWTSNEELGSAYTVDGVRTFSCTFSIDPIPVYVTKGAISPGALDLARRMNPRKSRV